MYGIQEEDSGSCNLANVFMMGDTFKQQHSTTRSPRSFSYPSPIVVVLCFLFPRHLYASFQFFHACISYPILSTRHLFTIVGLLRVVIQLEFPPSLSISYCSPSNVHQSFTSLFLQYLVYAGYCPDITSLVQLLQVFSLIRPMSLMFVW